MSISRQLSDVGDQQDTPALMGTDCVYMEFVMGILVIGVFVVVLSKTLATRWSVPLDCLMIYIARRPARK